MRFRNESPVKAILFCLMLLIAWAGVCRAAPPARIVSLAPNVTEVICALGLERNLVGVTTFCDYPASVRGKPTVGGPANPSLERILELRPDLVVVDEEGSGHNFAGRLERLGIRTALFRASRLSGLAAGIRRLGRDLGIAVKGERLAARIEQSLRTAERKQTAYRALFVIWPDPLVTAGSGTLIDDALRLVGFRNIASEAPGTYPRLSLEAVTERNPEILVVGSGHARIFPMEKLLRRLASVDAVREGRICYVGDALYRSGPRIPEGIGELRRCAERFLPEKPMRRKGSGS